MGVPVTEFAAVMQALSNHGVKYMKNEDINAMLRAMSPMFKPGYQESIERESTNQIRSLIERWEKAIAGDSGDEELEDDLEYDEEESDDADSDDADSDDEISDADESDDQESTTDADSNSADSSTDSDGSDGGSSDAAA